MRDLLATESAGVLAQLAWSRVLLAFDYDGTLAPIVADRSRARMRAVTADLLAKLCGLYPCSVISGRSRADLASRLQGARVKYVIGNHGIEPGSDTTDLERDVLRVRAHLERLVAEWQGVELEDKRYSLALHYRKSRQSRLARDAILKAVGKLPARMRAVSGKKVINLIPARAPNKGQALLRLRAAEGADTALYVGDDLCDEDVFTLDQPGRLLSVRIGASSASAAPYFVCDQRDIDRLLARLVKLGQQRKAS
jgi:trehalose 6-phosphate phosphatase